MTWGEAWLWLGVRLDASLGITRQTVAPIRERTLNAKVLQETCTAEDAKVISLRLGGLNVGEPSHPKHAMAKHQANRA